MRKACLDAVPNEIAKNSKIIFIGSDLGKETLHKTKKLFPNQFYMEGIAEQHLVGFAAGLALEGFIPFIHTISTFLTRRALDQIMIDVGLHDLPVILLGGGGGLTYAPLGPTHQSIEDFALMRTVPGMSVIAPGDPLEMKEVIADLASFPKPAYIRIGRGGEPVVTDKLSRFKFGKFRMFKVHKTDLTLFVTGSLLHEALDALTMLSNHNIKINLVHVPYVEPFDEECFKNLVHHESKIYVVEEHILNGGLFSRIAETLATNGIRAKLIPINLPKQFSTKYGSQRDHWIGHGLDSSGICSIIKETYRS